MKVLVVGAAGRTGSHALRMMLAAHEGPVLGMVRRPKQRDAVAAFGAEPVLCDLTRVTPDEGEASLDQALAGVDAVVCAAGAADPAEAEAVDHLGTVRLIEAAKAAGVQRFVLISSLGADRPERMAPSLRPFLQAKQEAEKALAASGLGWTVLRPGGLTDEPGSGRVRLGENLGESGSVPRTDVARVAVAALRLGVAEGRALELLSGDTPIEEALRGL
ncbi:MAG: SDR family oxidoreductase [Deinococcales bacterium]